MRAHSSSAVYTVIKIDIPAQSEAVVYAQYLQELGIPNEAIYVEDESQETLGNILFAKMNILMKHQWHKVLVLPSYNHSTERIEYILQKVLSREYDHEIFRVGENKAPANLAREAKSFKYTKEINDKFADGDHEAIYKGLMATHPAYGGTKWTIEELRKELRS